MKQLSFLSIILSICLLFATGCEKESTESGDEAPIIELELPADPQPENTSFPHRILLIQHTGTACPNCPGLMSSLKELSEDINYVTKYHHVAAHSYNEIGDAAYSQAAHNLSQAFCDNNYPELTFNLTRENTGTSISVKTIKEDIDRRHKETAQAGITAATQLTSDILNITAGIKAAEVGTYRIAAWLLEDNILSKQENAREEWQNTHNNAIRAMAGKTLNVRIYGEKVGERQAGAYAEASFSLKLDEAWKPANCKVLILVNALTSTGTYDLVNCALCPINGTLDYQYK